jgi:hypothetical protein
MESPKKSDNAEFDIRNLMNYDLIRRSLAKHPTELCLFEVTCILINNNLKNNNLKDEKKS